MSLDQQRLHAYLSAVTRQFAEVRGIISTGLSKQFPLEVAIELQHMLMHLVSARKMEGSDYSSKIREIASALGHVDRAYLDACKVLVRENFSSLKHNLSFMQEWVSGRQAEGKRHSRDKCGASSDELPLERINPICELFKQILLNHRLMTVPRGTRAGGGAGDNWSVIVPEVETWLSLDLLYNSLAGKKHLEALQVMLLSFMEMDKDRLQRLNLQIMLDTLSVGALQAASLGWKHFGALKPHLPFLATYTTIRPWQEVNVIGQQSWIRPVFDELRMFYVNR